MVVNPKLTKNELNKLMVPLFIQHSLLSLLERTESIITSLENPKEKASQDLLSQLLQRLLMLLNVGSFLGGVRVVLLSIVNSCGLTTNIN